MMGRKRGGREYTAGLLGSGSGSGSGSGLLVLDHGLYI